LKKTWIILIALLAGLLAGCIVTKNEFERSKADLEMTKRELQTQEKKLSNIETVVSSDFKERFIRVENNLEEIRRRFLTGQGALDVRVDEITNDLRMIQGKLEDNNQLVSELNNRLEDANQQIQALQYRLEVLEGKGGTPKGTSPAPGSSPKPAGKKGETPAPKEAVSAEAPSPKAGAGTAAVPKSEQVYQMAYNDYVKGNYELAISGFRSFISLFPKDLYVSNAQYWVGECFYSLGKYKESITEFEGVIKNYPNSQKHRAAWLKRGFAYIELKEIEKGKQSLKELLERYPNTEEGKKAKEKIDQLH
jgi:tol-pal system protein YbgF